MNTSKNPQFKHSELNEGKGVWVQNSAIAALLPGRQPKTAAQISHEYGNGAIHHPEHDLVLDHEPAQADQSQETADNLISQVHAQQAAFDNSWKSLENDLRQEAFNGGDFSNEKPVVVDTEEFLNRVQGGAPPTSRFCFFGFGSLEIDTKTMEAPGAEHKRQAVQERYIKARRILALFQRRFPNTKITVVFHDFLYQVPDLYRLRLWFEGGDRNPVGVSTSNDWRGLAECLGDESAILFMHSSGTPYRQIISEHLVRAIEGGAAHPKAVACYPAESNDDDTKFEQPNCNDTSNMVGKWLGYYRDPHVQLTDMDDPDMKNMVLHTIGRVAKPSEEQPRHDIQDVWGVSL